jgi:protein required for attachment to host cells
MVHSWIVVADASCARIFSSNGNLSQFQEIETLTHPASRLHDRDLTSDLPGRAFDSHGTGRHAMGQATDPKKHERDAFALQIAAHLDAERNNHSYEHLVLVATPEMLGLLREHLSPEVRKRVSDEIHKDLVRHSAEDIKKHLPEFLPA